MTPTMSTEEFFDPYFEEDDWEYLPKSVEFFFDFFFDCIDGKFYAKMIMAGALLFVLTIIFIIISS